MQETQPPTRHIEFEPGPISDPTPAGRAGGLQGTVFFIGNATVLIRFGGFTILTDPTFIHMHEEVSIGYGLHSKRLTDPALDIADLPPLDFVLLSHFHGDHFDQVAEAELDKTLPIVTTAEAAKELNKRGFEGTHALDTWEAINLGKGGVNLRITALPARHGPPVVDLLLPEVMGSLLEWELPGHGAIYRMYITGDTLLIDELHEIRRRYPNIDLALLHLGGTMVLGILVTMDAEQGVAALQIIEPELAIPIHYNDYDVFKSPLSDFQKAVAEAGLANKVHYLSHGDTYTFTV
jgi:L-ascorbate metabolism protein UlaG (beta-lactamase superfamily)